MAALTPPIISEVSLVYQPKVKAVDRPRMDNSMESEAILREYWSNDIHLLEEFNFLMLDRGNRVIGFSNAAKGGIVGVMVDPRLIILLVEMRTHNATVHVIKTASFGEVGRGEICHEAKVVIYTLTSETENCYPQSKSLRSRSQPDQLTRKLIRYCAHEKNHPSKWRDGSLL
ncbi:hypothetical protein FUA23_20345 [Neolewinella aurantiaca]|uniref:RadC-like JAB domain-containing protein n=1 Tax=Neolewinella aurantiaca TaxID=2602767 RepID=A0A5C7F4R7_9BACT|nr:hypothetical protein FUA23_20345 [Neolewinella aurantiaca]